MTGRRAVTVGVPASGVVAAAAYLPVLTAVLAVIFLPVALAAWRWLPRPNEKHGDRPLYLTVRFHHVKDRNDRWEWLVTVDPIGPDFKPSVRGYYSGVGVNEIEAPIEGRAYAKEVVGWCKKCRWRWWAKFRGAWEVRHQNRIDRDARKMLGKQSYRETKVYR